MVSLALRSMSVWMHKWVIGVISVKVLIAQKLMIGSYPAERILPLHPEPNLYNVCKCHQNYATQAKSIPKSAPLITTSALPITKCISKSMSLYYEKHTLYYKSLPPITKTISPITKMHLLLQKVHPLLRKAYPLLR